MSQILLVFLLFVLSILSSCTCYRHRIYHCPATIKNYAINSNGTVLFHTNLELLLSSLSSSTVATGFFKDARSTRPNRVFGLALCQRNLSPLDCRSCLSIATSDILRLCPNKKEATIWYDSDCLLRYANWRFFTKLTSFQHIVTDDKIKSITADPIRYAEVRNTLLNDLITQASNRTVLSDLFAMGEAEVSEVVKLCAREIYDHLIAMCVYMGSSLTFKHTVTRAKEEPFFGESCILRCETYLFYTRSTTTLPPPPPTPPPTNDGAKIDSTKKVGLFLGSVGCVVILTILIVWYCKKEVFHEYNEPPTHALPPATCQQTCLVTSGAAPTPLFPALCSTDDFSDVWDTQRISSTNKNMQSTESSNEEMAILSGSRMALVIPKDFSTENQIREFPYVAVYKGLLPDGTRISSKKLKGWSAVGTTVEELEKELHLVAKIKHANVIRLLGYSIDEEDDLLLVYEYLPGLSLDHILSDPVQSKTLDWKIRLNMFTRVAETLLYLHKEYQHTFIPPNLELVHEILLDGRMNPMISYFGPMKFFRSQEESHRIPPLCVAPEYAKDGISSMKTDVYSFGILVLEIIAGRRSSEEKPMNLIDHVRNRLSEGNISELVDEGLDGDYSIKDVERCIRIALLCLQEDADLRPDMVEVVDSLVSIYEEPPASLLDPSDSSKLQE